MDFSKSTRNNKAQYNKNITKVNFISVLLTSDEENSVSLSFKDDNVVYISCQHVI